MRDCIVGRTLGGGSSRTRTNDPSMIVDRTGPALVIIRCIRSEGAQIVDSSALAVIDCMRGMERFDVYFTDISPKLLIACALPPSWLVAPGKRSRFTITHLRKTKGLAKGTLGASGCVAHAPGDRAFQIFGAGKLRALFSHWY